MPSFQFIHTFSVVGGVPWLFRVTTVFNILEGSLKIILANPQQVKALRGKKTDPNDSRRLASLLRRGLVQGSRAILRFANADYLPLVLGSRGHNFAIRQGSDEARDRRAGRHSGAQPTHQ
jgi:hypothetical protein